MSQHSSPARSEHGSSVTQAQDAEVPLTPRSKVRAMLAALDDSESDAADAKLKKTDYGVQCPSYDRGSIDETSTTNLKTLVKDTENMASNEDEGDDDHVFLPRGKLAARLQRNHHTAVPDDSPIEEEPTDAYSRVRQQLLKRSEMKKSASEGTVQSEDSEKATKPIRKLLTRKKQPLAKDVESQASPIQTPRRSKSSSRSTPVKRTPNLIDRPVREGVSPGLSVTPDKSTPSRTRRPTSDTESSKDSSDQGSNAKKSRLAELVARKKEERRAKEAIERKKREERAAIEPISSGASEADSEKDLVADKRLTQLSKPTRKASKRALDEIARENERMKQETQRINRNRQLTHQAVTKKKITKESLLARFNFLPATTTKDNGQQSGSSSAHVSSALQSDAEEAGNVQTPSTSPLIPSQDRSKTSQAGPLLQQHTIVQEQTVGSAMSAANAREWTQPFADLSEEELPTLDELVTRPPQRSPKGKGKAIEIRSPKGKEKAFENGLDSVEDGMDSMGFHLQDAQDSIGVTYHRLDKGKGKAVEIFNQAPSTLKQKSKTVFTQPPIKVTPLLPRASNSGSDSDDLEIEFITTKHKSPLRSRLEILNRAPLSKAADQRPLQNLRALAHLTSPSRQKGKSRASMTTAEMQQSLQMKARQQAARERAEKIQDARDRGVIIQTADERERDQADLEDLLEKTRKEVGELSKKEKAAAKQEGKENGGDGLSSSEDDDYKEEEEEEHHVADSGSEVNEDEEDEAEEDDDLENKKSNNHLIDREASEDEANEEDGISESESDSLNNVVDEANDDDVDGELVKRALPKYSRRSKTNRVIDDEDDMDLETPRKPLPQNPLIPHLPGSDVSPIGLTQAFAATMESGDTQTQQVEGEKEQQEFLAFVHGEAIPNFALKQDVDMGDSMVADSQAGRDETQGLDLNLEYVPSQIDRDTVQTQMRPPILATQISDMPEPSQDVGFQVSSPAPDRFVSVPPSTVETVLLAKESPIKDQVRKKGRLRQRIQLDNDAFESEGEQSARNQPVAEFVISANAFDVLKKGSKTVEKGDTFDKKTSEAKEMIEEQAQESEDEYAGLGGASDDESGGEMDEEVRNMVNDEEVKVDERKLAAFYA